MNRHAPRKRGIQYSRGAGNLSLAARRTGSPGQALRDSHIWSEFPAAKHGLERLQPLHHDNGSWFAVVAGPSAKSRAHPTGVRQRPFGMGVLLFLGLAFEALANRLQRRLILG